MNRSERRRYFISSIMDGSSNRLLLVLLYESRHKPCTFYESLVLQWSTSGTFWSIETRGGEGRIEFIDVRVFLLPLGVKTRDLYILLYDYVKGL